MSSVNYEIKKIADYCDKNKVGILRIDVPGQSFIIEQQNGTPTSCTFDEVPALNYAKPKDLTRDALIELIQDYDKYMEECRQQRQFYGDLLNVSDYLHYQDEKEYEKIEVVRFDYDSSMEVCDYPNDFHLECRIQTNNKEKHSDRIDQIWGTLGILCDTDATIEHF